MTLATVASPRPFAHLMPRLVAWAGPQPSSVPSAGDAVELSPAAQEAAAADRYLDGEALFQEYYRGEAGATPDNLAYQDRGIDASPYAGQVAQYASRLEVTPAAGRTAGPAFPRTGEMPAVEGGLEYLHPDIKQAAVVVSTRGADGVHGRWMGRNATESVQQWSSSKLIPILRTVSLADQAAPGVDLSQCDVRDPSGSQPRRPFAKVVDDVVSYRDGVWSSNSEARMLKQFDTPRGIEGWVRDVTGDRSPDMEFRGGYGAPPAVSRPQLIDRRSGQVILQASGADHTGNNLVSSYDLTRMMAMTGLHNRLPEDARLPGVQWDSLKTAATGFGTDSARFADVAIERLGLQASSPVIISKLGFGTSDSRRATEMVYTAYVEFNDEKAGWTSVAMSLRAAKPVAAGGREALELDARMAAAVTQILERAVKERP